MHRYLICTWVYLYQTGRIDKPPVFQLSLRVTKDTAKFHSIAVPVCCGISLLPSSTRRMEVTEFALRELAGTLLKVWLVSLRSSWE